MHVFHWAGALHSDCPGRHLLKTSMRKKKKNTSIQGQSHWVEFAHSPRVWVGFLWVLWPPLTSQRCAVRWIGVSTQSQSKWVWVWVKWPWNGRTSCSGLVPLWFWDAGRGSIHLQPWIGINWLEKNSLVFIHLSYMYLYISHFFQCLILEVLGSLIRSLVMILWSESVICHRILTLVSIN